MSVQVYSGSKSEGMVRTVVSADSNRVDVSYDDGDISTTVQTWSYKKEKGKYFLEMSEITNTMYGEAPLTKKTFRINAKNERKAAEAMIEKIVEPHINEDRLGFPMDVEEVRKGLAKLLVR